MTTRRDAHRRLAALARLPLCALLAGVLLAAPAFATGEPKLIYRKVFKSSSPEFIEVTLTPSGSGLVDIRQLDDDPDPQPIEFSPQFAARLFELAGELKHFHGIDLEVKRRLANLGEKTFRYESNGEAGETTFNYTVNQTAVQLMQAFEGIARQEGHRQTLQHRLRFDRLGLDAALKALEVDLHRGLIPEPARLVPALEAVSNDSRVLEMARARARALAERMRAGR
jgi:hypothetical protein